ncbi:macro domain-containing protein [Nocardia vermiculata]|uniref:Macro domain-containing protein n=2 Tax=Nocardia vermiculata TaxID=257274 RepID=A0A846XZL6_9NOCA|nr:macro domain-containing protein [Nocardia vermiculata]
MGKGIALQFKRAYPEMYKAYSAAAKAGELQIGAMHVWETGALAGPRVIINFPTKRHWRSPSTLDDVAAGLPALVEALHKYSITSVAIPPLGCGNGGLDWRDVAPLMWQALSPLADTIDIRIYPPEGAPAASEMTDRTNVPKMTAARAAVIRLLQVYEEYSFHPPSLIEVQKLAYFLQGAGQNLRLDFSKGTYGPYADALRKSLRNMEGHYIEGFGDGSAKVPEAEPISVKNSAELQAAHVLDDAPETAARVGRVIELADGFTSMYGLELLATVHWTVTREHATTSDEVFNKIQSWTPRKAALFTRQHVDTALTHLTALEWLPVSA